jgi:beta-glucanase (GH16 family)
LLLPACSEPNASSSSNWLVCQQTQDCANFPGTVSCGNDGFCEGADGHKVEAQLVFEDTFSNTSLDPASFAYETGFSIRNADSEAYTSRPQNVFIENGDLVLQANAEQLGQAAYTSGSVDTQGLQSFSYGKIAARIWAPDGKGVGPAFWMLPEHPGANVNVCEDNGQCVASTYPAWGDIVIMTVRSEQPTQLLHTASYATFDTATQTYIRGQGGMTEALAASLADGYHEYAVEWGPARIDWLTDGKVVASFDTTAADIYHPSGQNPFAQAFNLRLSLAVGGLSEAPDPSAYPQQMRVDWLRVWQYQ